ncbi:50S ribosomal protein L32 [Candidatus Falkowbacteria bacterium]|nr:50S ribosomal protein L32 [Candidatus Falkowbacteria bacterium]
MGLPSKKRTKTSKRQRAAHFALKAVKLNKCPHCRRPVLPHHACEFCGYYKDRQIITIKIKKKTEKQRAQARKQDAREREKEAPRNK